MARTHRVDVVPLHKLNVGNHLRQRNRASVLQRMLMPVDAVELDGLAVEQKRMSVDAHLLEPDTPAADVVSAPDDEGVEAGLLSRPCTRREYGGVGARRRRGFEVTNLFLVQIIK